MANVGTRMFGCCCGDNCLEVEDDFSTDTSANYSGSGTLSISGGEASTTATAGRFIHSTTGASGAGSVTVTGKVSAAGSFRVIGAYTDANNYLFAEVTINGASSLARIWRRSSGSNTAISGTLTFTGSLDTYYTVTLCWDGTNAFIVLDGIGDGMVASTMTGTGRGFATNLVSGTATFTHFAFYTHEETDAACEPCNIEQCCRADNVGGGLTLYANLTCTSGCGNCTLNTSATLSLAYQSGGDTVSGYAWQKGTAYPHGGGFCHVNLGSHELGCLGSSYYPGQQIGFGMQGGFTNYSAGGNLTVVSCSPFYAVGTGNFYTSFPPVTPAATFDIEITE